MQGFGMQPYGKFSKEPVFYGDTFHRYCSNLQHLFYHGVFGEIVFTTIDTVVSMNPEKYADLVNVFGPNLGEMVREIKKRQYEYVYPKVTEFVSARRYLLSDRCHHPIEIVGMKTQMGVVVISL